ncbi:MAG TPA: MerR family transcriptional regulator, partial [Propionibacteriaceae bacterium]|nr:MerR family transcriptional regulator [Propionibacteriaceae bacterium]
MTKTNADEPTLHIGAVATRTQLSIRTIRHYDDVGLVRPSGRSVGGFRLYTQPDVDRLLLIRRMKPLGFTLDEMADLLAITDAHQTSPDAATTAALGGYVTLATER